MCQHVGPDRGWIGLLPDLDVRYTSSNHDHLLNEPNVRVLAQHLLSVFS